MDHWLQLNHFRGDIVVSTLFVCRDLKATSKPSLITLSFLTNSSFFFFYERKELIFLSGAKLGDARFPTVVQQYSQIGHKEENSTCWLLYATFFSHSQEHPNLLYHIFQHSIPLTLSIFQNLHWHTTYFYSYHEGEHNVKLFLNGLVILNSAII